jgi:hypothetical protein
MSPSGMLRSVPPVRTDFSEKRIASIIRMTRIDELVIMSAVTRKIVFLRSMLQLLVTADVAPSSAKLATLMIEPIIIRATRHNITEEDVLHSHCRQHLKS